MTPPSHIHRARFSLVSRGVGGVECSALSPGPDRHARRPRAGDDSRAKKVQGGRNAVWRDSHATYDIT